MSIYNIGIYGVGPTNVGWPGVGGVGRFSGTEENWGGAGVQGWGNPDIGGTVGVHGISGSTPSLAGYFQGTVQVRDGSFVVSGGRKIFRIDHPLDPENKYLQQACVESPEMKNVYDSVVEHLYEDGSAWVELPEWFGQLNRDFRYQRTAVGEPASELHIAEEISEETNRFKIAGGEEGIKICRQVTGIRKDRAPEAHPLEVELGKPEGERGRYLNPELYDVPQERRVVAGFGTARGRRSNGAPSGTTPIVAPRRGQH